MKTSSMKNEIHEYIDGADEALLKRIYGLIKADLGDKKYHLNTEELSLIEERLIDYERNPTAGTSWDEVKKRLLSGK